MVASDMRCPLQWDDGARRSPAPSMGAAIDVQDLARHERGGAMPRPYLVDLRERALLACEDGTDGCSQIARRFRVPS